MNDKRESRSSERNRFNDATTSDKSRKTRSVSSSSKLNRILSNLERSILNQFGVGQQDGTTKSRKDSNRDSSGRSNRRKVSKPISPVKTESNRSASNNNGADAANGSERNLNQQVSNSNEITTSKMHQTAMSNGNGLPSIESGLVGQDKISPQMKGDATMEKQSKLSLNKYQRQVITTTLPNQQPVFNSSIINNRLSIPPPHAIERERNQSHHHLLFANSSLDDQSFDTASSKLPETRQSLESSNRNQLTSNEPTRTKFDTTKFETSSASSSHSLPPLALKVAGFQQTNRNSVEDEDSGFFSYQSRRSFAQVDNNPTSTTTAQSNKDNSERNNMFIQGNREPIMRMNQFNSPTHAQQVFYQYHPNTSRMNQQQQQQVALNSQKLATSNHVPIVLVNPDINDSYNIDNAKFHQLPSYAMQHDDNSCHISRQMIPPQLTRTAIQFNPVLDSGQQIYANAPPKPRRYQYYDMGQLQQNSAIVNRVAPSISNSMIPTSCQPASVEVYINRPVMQMSQAPNSLFFPVQRMYNVTYNQMQNSPQQMSIPVSVYQNQIINPPSLYNGQFSQSQQRGNSNTQMQLPKSKSSLDANDLARFKMNKQVNSQALHNFSHNSQRHLQPQVPYSQPGNLIGYSSSVAETNGLRPQTGLNSNLIRSKSVTHLAPMPDQIVANQAKNDLVFGMRQAQGNNPKLLSSSSMSTSNLNMVGIMNLSPTTASAPNKFYRTMSQLGELSLGHPGRYHDQRSIQNDQVLQVAAPRQMHTQSRAMSYRQTSTNPSNQNQHANSINNKVFSNNGKIARQTTSDGVARNCLPGPSLDDKIRYLLIDQDIEAPIESDRQASGAISHRFTDSDSANWNFASKQCVSSDSSSRGEKATRTYGFQASPVSTDKVIGANLQPKTNPSSYPSCVNFQEQKKSPTSMGNRQNRNYQLRDLTEANETGHFIPKMDSNSQLIVDLTTPRVLATTQTLIPSKSQVDNTLNNMTRSTNQVSSQEPLKSSILKEANGLDNVSNLKNPFMVKHCQAESSRTDEGAAHERFAPYYYSDLKSAEQQQALLNIVQQKSLSPPPPLTSRSADLSSTRLAPKSSEPSKNLNENLNKVPQVAINQSASNNIIKAIVRESVGSTKAKAELPSKTAPNFCDGAQQVDGSNDSSIRKISAREETKKDDNSEVCITVPASSNSSISEWIAASAATDPSSESKVEVSRPNNCNSSLSAIQQEEDFIEYFSNDGPEHHSQFEASQFSASDFNSSTSNSECSDPVGMLNSPNAKQVPKHQYSNGLSLNTSGRQKLTRARDKYKVLEEDDESIGMDDSGSNSHHTDDKDSDKLVDCGPRKFNNVLGNVIDVEVCPMNPLSRCSLVGGRA